MKQTAVEWLKKEIIEIIFYLEEDGSYAIQGAKDKLFGEKNILEQAKEMEKQQIIDACKYGNNFEQGDLNCYSYYDKNFKSE